MSGAGVLLCAVLQQLPTPVHPGTIAGRVCVDRDADARCGADEPGLSGIRVLLETGMWAVTDARGRYHFAAVEGRAFELDQKPRLVLGRHRVKLDTLTLDDGAVVEPKGATVELPEGALVTQDFAVTLPEREVGAVRRAPGARPRGEFQKQGFRVQLTGEVAPGERVSLQGKPAAIGTGGVYQGWVEVQEGENRVVLRVDASGNRSRFYLQSVDVVRRESAVMVVPREPEGVGSLAVPASATGDLILALEAPAGTRVKIDDVEVELPEGGRLSVPLPPKVRASLHVAWTTPAGESLEDEVSLQPASGVSAAALLDAELGWAFPGGFRWAGRGAASVRGRLLGFDFAAELDLRDEDLRTLPGGQAASFFVPRERRVFERARPVFAEPPQWADDSAAIAENPAAARLRAEVSRAGIGRLGFGSYRATIGSDSEVGRYHRALTAAYLEARTPDELPVRAGLRGFYSPGAADPVLGLALQPRHERFEATGGSLFYLSSQAAEGSEQVRIEYVDGLTGLPVGERHLRRGVDYAFDPVQGRLLLARPLWSFEDDRVRSAAPPTSSPAPVLWVDYEAPVLGAPAGSVFGAEARIGAGPVSAAIAHARQAGYQLYRGNVSAQLGPVWLSAEVAHSLGVEGASALRLSDDGGLWWRPGDGAGVLSPAATGAWAITGRARGPMLFGRGAFDLAFRRRGAGFLDAQHFDTVLFQQLSARVEQPVKDFVVAAWFDDRIGADPRVPFSATSIHQRVIGGALGYEAERWGVRVEGRDVELDGAGRSSLGLSGRFRVTDWLTLRAAHRQRILSRNGGFDDTFASAGVEVSPTPALTLGVRGGWGPQLGPQVWGNVQVQRGDEVHYGGQALDLDAPSIGERRLVTGVRKEIDPGTAVFVEDAAAHDATTLRLSRAVGLTQRLAEGMTISLRYERGLRAALEGPADRSRDAGGVSLSWVGARARAWLRGEVRSEQGGATASLVQWLGWGGGEAQLRDDLRATLNAIYSHTMQGPAMTARLFEGVAGLAWRFSAGMVVARYSYRRELSPLDPREKFRHRVSLLPSVHVASRVTLAAGGHLQLDDGGLAVIATLRPAVRVWRGLELGLEGALGYGTLQGRLYALRAEVGYRLTDGFLFAVGGTIIGFTGLDVLPDGQSNRVYLRLEAAY